MRTIVVGAGILGASVAYHLALEGAEVEVIDAAHDGKATLAGAGIICPWTADAEDADFYRLYAAGGLYYPELVTALTERGEADTSYRRVGALVLANNKAELKETEAWLMPRLAAAPEAGAVSRLSGREAQELFPPLRNDLVALHIANGGRVEARAIAGAMMRIAIANGAISRAGRVTLARQGSRVVAMLDGSMLEADIVVLTAGAWATKRWPRSELQSQWPRTRPACTSGPRHSRPVTGRCYCPRAGTTCWPSTITVSSSARRVSRARASITGRPPAAWRRC